MTLSGFTGEHAADRYRDAYERALARLWPKPRTTTDTRTAFGTTRTYRAGPPDGAPIVLLPGSRGNALMWHAYVETLTRDHPVIAVDPVGEPGASVQTAPIDDDRDAAAWLEELLAALEVTEAQIVGCSYGGWLALCHHIRHPGRTAALTLVDPAGFAEAGRRFFAWAIAGGMAGMAPAPFRPRLARLVGNGAILDGELMRLGRASTGFRRALPVPHVLSDDALRRVRVPTLFLLGAHSALHDSRRVAARVGGLVPSARVEIVPGTGHALPSERPELVAERILGAARR